MTETYDKLNHWYGWNGGERPVHPETAVEICTGSEQLEDRADEFAWFHDGDSSDIIAFRIIKLHVEPREFWIVGALAYQSERMAIADFPGMTAIHVREVEQPL